VHKWDEKTVLSPSRAPISGSEVFFFPSPGKQLLAKSYVYCLLINGGCGLSHERVENSCKITEVGGLKTLVSLMHAQAESEFQRNINFINPLNKSNLRM